MRLATILLIAATALPGASQAGSPRRRASIGLPGGICRCWTAAGKSRWTAWPGKRHA